jgi:hypothetical protein
VGLPLNQALNGDTLETRRQHRGRSVGNNLGLFRGLAGKNKSGTHAPSSMANPLQPAADVSDLRRVVDKNWRVAWPEAFHNAPRDYQGDNTPVRPVRWVEHSGMKTIRTELAHALVLN